MAQQPDGATPIIGSTKQLLEDQQATLQAQKALLQSELASVDRVLDAISRALEAQRNIGAVPRSKASLRNVPWETMGIQGAIDILLAVNTDGMTVRQLAEHVVEHKVQTKATDVQASTYSIMKTKPHKYYYDNKSGRWFLIQQPADSGAVRR